MEINQITWGDDSAEKDPNLQSYFVTSQPYRRLAEKAKNIVIGRKGSGKSALRTMLTEIFEQQENTHVINLSPKYNSIRTILNDRDISEQFGKEIFFQHTWLRQILLDSLCKIGDTAKGTYATESLEFARKISLQLNRTSKDLVENISEILGSLKVKAGSLGDLGLTIERQLRDIAEVDALEHHLVALCDSGAKIVILVDDLDLGWDNSETANNLLLGLLAATNYIAGAHKNIHTTIFLREDVYSILISQTQHSDKYRNVERLRWEKEELIQILSNRIAFNYQQSGENAPEDPFLAVFPNMVGTTYCDNWLVEGGSKTFYSYSERHEPRFEEVQIHPCFRRAVNTVDRIRNRS